MLSAAHVTTLRLILQYYTRNKDTLKVVSIIFLGVMFSFDIMVRMMLKMSHSCCLMPADRELPVRPDIRAVQQPAGKGWKSVFRVGSPFQSGQSDWHPHFAFSPKQPWCVRDAGFKMHTDIVIYTILDYIFIQPTTDLVELGRFRWTWHETRLKIGRTLNRAILISTKIKLV